MKLMSSIIGLSCLIVSGLGFAEQPSETPKVAAPAQVKINLNAAKAEQLLHIIKGIGAKRAQAIVEYREQHGPYKSIQDLAAVQGLGEHFISIHATELQALLSF